MGSMIDAPIDASTLGNEIGSMVDTPIDTNTLGSTIDTPINNGSIEKDMSNSNFNIGTGNESQNINNNTSSPNVSNSNIDVQPNQVEKIKSPVEHRTLSEHLKNNMQTNPTVRNMQQSYDIGKNTGMKMASLIRNRKNKKKDK